MPDTMPGPPPALFGAVVFAKDLQRMAAFYRGTAGLAVTHEAADHVVLESAALQLVLHGIPKRIADSITISDPPQPREDTAIKLFFPVTSLADTRTRAKALGGRLKPPKAEWTARGFTACDGIDPEGNVVQFRQPAAATGAAQAPAAG